MSLSTSHALAEIELTGFLRSCLNSRRYQPDLDLVRGQAGQVNWQSVIAHASEKHVASTLFGSLKDTGLLDADLTQSLHAVYLQTAQRNLLQAAELKNLLARLSEQNIECLLLKGLALAVPIYGDIAARPARDMDLLLQKHDLQRALPLFEALGYRRYDTPEHDLTDLEFENEIILFRQYDGMNVDLHWSPIDSPYYQRRLDPQWFWHKTQEFKLGGINIRTLAPEANLVYLSAHLVLHHRGDELLWSNDIAELLFSCQHRLDWELVLEKARAFSLVLPLRQVMARQATDWHAPIPGWFLDRLESLPVVEEEQRVFDTLSGERLHSGRHFLSDLRLLDGWGSRIRYSLQLVFPSRAYMLRRYKLSRPWLVPLYYPYRWWLGIYSLIRRSR